MCTCIYYVFVLFILSIFFLICYECGCFENCVDVLVICVLVFTVFFVLFLLCILILICYYCGCFENCVCVLVICVLVFTVFLYCFVCVYLFLFVTSVKTTATE